MPTLLDTLAAKLPTNEPLPFRSATLSVCVCGAIPTGILSAALSPATASYRHNVLLSFHSHFRDLNFFYWSI